MSPMFVVLVVMVLVFIPLLYYTSSLGEQSYFEREFIVRDIGLLIDAIHASPNDVKINYPDTKGLNISFKKDLISSSKFDEKNQISGFYIVPSGLYLYETDLNPKIIISQGEKIALKYNLMIEKNTKDGTIIPQIENNNIVVEKRSKINEFISTKDVLKDQVITIMVDHLTTKTNKDIENSICFGIVSKGQNIFPTDNFGCNDQKIKPISESNMVIIIEASNDVSDNELIVEYFGNQGEYDQKRKSEKLAFIISDNFKEIDGFESSVKTTFAGEFSNIQDKPIVKIKASVLASSKQTSDISKQVYESIKEYYET